MIVYKALTIIVKPAFCLLRKSPADCPLTILTIPVLARVPAIAAILETTGAPAGLRPIARAASLTAIL